LVVSAATATAVSRHTVESVAVTATVESVVVSVDVVLSEEQDAKLIAIAHKINKFFIFCFLMIFLN
jgi:hypothetical protein